MNLVSTYEMELNFEVINKMRLVGIILLNLASKYTERIAFKISDIALKTGLQLNNDTF